jgi:dihydroneopterin aldolase
VAGFIEMTTIKINNAKFYAYHGVLDYEKQYGNLFEVDIVMECDLSGLKDSDDLKKTVNYLEVYNRVKELFHKDKFHLIETMNQEICKMVLTEFELVKKVTVHIRKPNAPLGIIDSVEIINEKSKFND